MAFNVTQCPSCDSTFNTNARLLESAAGKVRCGACLTVFEAELNYIGGNDGDPDIHPNESVFVGNDPQEFFDPSVFLSRRSLTEIDTPAFTEDPDESGPSVDASDDATIDPQQAAVIDEEPFTPVDEERLSEE